MPEEPNNSARQAVTDSPARARYGPTHRLLRRGVIVLVVIALLGLFFSFAPRYIARYLVASQLEELGIDYEGVKTLSVNPWTGDLWLGPVRFGTGPSDRGQLGELGLTLRFNPLLKHRVSIERLLVRGIDLVVTRGKDHALALNGIPLSQFMVPPEAHVQPEKRGDAWGAGVDSLELLDSRLVFQDRDRGELEVDVERLALTAFETWEPDRAGRFELAARVNDIQLNWSGEARPFADNVTLVIDSRTKQADVPKLVRFTGPWGLDRRDGTYDAELKYEVTLFDSGRLEGHAAGAIDIQGADYERAGVFALTLERAKVDLDVHYSLSEAGDFALKGKLATDLGRSTGAVREDTRFAVAAGRVAIGGLDTTYARDGTLHLQARPEIDLETAAFSGPIEISADKLLELLALLQSLSAGAAVSTADTGLADFADASVAVPRSDVKVGRLQSRGGALSLQSNEGWVELGLKTNSDLFDINIGVGERTISIERLQSLLEGLSLKSGRGRLTLDMAGVNSLVTGTSVSPIGELKIGAFETDIDRLGLQVQTGAVSLQLAAASQVNGVSALLFAQGARPETQLHLGAASAALSEASLDAQGGALRWQAAGRVAVDSLTADFAKGKEGAVKFARAEIKALQANDQLQLAADALTIDGLDLYVKRSLLAALIGDKGAGADKAVSSGDAPAQPSAATPPPETGAQEVDLSRVQALLTELGYAPGPVDGLMGRRTAAAIGDFQRREGLAVDGRSTSALLAALESRAAAPADSEVAAAPRNDVPRQAGPAVRLGRFALTGNPVLRFRDDLVTPQVKVDSVFKQVEVRNLDTQKTAQRTDLSLIADVNEFTHAELSGWVAGFGKTADLDIKAKVDNLELSTYSPYVADLAGVYLDSGQLDTVTAAKAEQGALQGEMQVELDDIAFRPLSKEDAERLSGKVGVPLETAVSLLQDSEGRIVLTLPIRGALSKPEVDASSAVNKAIGGALKKVFPPAMVASILAGVAKGSGPTFEPIEFAPGSVELGEAGKRYAAGVVKLLIEHPKLSLKVCGRATAQDMEHFIIEGSPAEPPATGGKGQAGTSETKEQPDLVQAEQALAELAVERKQGVRRYMIQEKGADAKRVRECRSTFDAADQGSPRVEISL